MIQTRGIATDCVIRVNVNISTVILWIVRISAQDIDQNLKK